MNTFDRLRSGAAYAAGVTAVLVMHCGSAFAQDQAGVEIGPEERANMQTSAPAQVSGPLPRSVLEAAAAYRSYMNTAGSIGAGFSDGEAVARSVRQGAAYEPKQMARGAVAYAAVVALQDRAFVQGVRALGGDPEGRKALINSLLSEPHRATVLPGADSAAGRISAAMGAEGGRVRDVGQRVKQAAYDVQHQAWSKAEVASRVERLAEVKTLSLTPMQPSDMALAELSQTVSTLPARAELASVSTAYAKPEPRPTAVGRGLALAALAALDAADPTSTETLLNDPECASCLRMSKLNLFQCLAVAKPWYEDVFCLGQHVLIDTGDCIYAASGARETPPVLARNGLFERRPRVVKTAASYGSHSVMKRSFTSVAPRREHDDGVRFALLW